MIETYSNILKKYWGYNSFRGIQLDIIDSVCHGRDTLGLMPTGGGKSITFQVPALAMQGVCLVVSPLIALMKDQVANLRKRHIPAAAITSDMGRYEIVSTLDNAIFGGIKILYVSPERLSSELFLTKLSKIDVSLITIDEAHCITQWGYDFRPSYLGIAEIRKLKPDAPILALTATATEDVVDDIQLQLGFREPNVFRMSFRRENLAYIVRPTDHKETELLHILKHTEGSSIVYVRTRDDSSAIAHYLSNNGVPATYYHAGLSAYDKDTRQREWQKDKVRVIVATNAFGMGIDKPNVRLVIHLLCPDSLEAYFQEAGRAGRDGDKSYAILLFGKKDIVTLRRHFTDRFPKKDVVRQVYEHLACFFQLGVGSGLNAMFNFDIDKFCHNFHYFPTTITASLEILNLSGYLDYSFDNRQMSRIIFLTGRDNLYLLHGNSLTTESVIEELLRLYGGLFTSLVPIDEALIAQYCNIGKADVQGILISLSQRGIIRYIPPQNFPYIRFVRPRVDKEGIIIPQNAYDQRFYKHQSREQAVEGYLLSTQRCRSQYLLNYFGEDNSEPCHQCDICLGYHRA